MISTHSGELAALLTAFFWSITAIAFESATRKVGSLVVNVIRLYSGLLFLSVFTWIYRGSFVPTDASQHAWIWLSISGLTGFVIGDYFLFKSYPIIGSRIAMVIMTLVPPITAIIGYWLMGEILSFMNILGMLLVISGIITVIMNRKKGKKGIRLAHSTKGIIFAFIGTVGQAVGLVFSKYGMRSYDAFAATQIRIIAGIIGFSFIITSLGKWKAIMITLFNKDAMKGIS